MRLEILFVALALVVLGVLAGGIITGEFVLPLKSVKELENQSLPEISEGKVEETEQEMPSPIDINIEEIETSKPTGQIESEPIPPLLQAVSGGGSVSESTQQHQSPSKTTTTVTIGSKTVSIGETFNLSIDIDAVQEVYAVQFDLYFNPKVIDALNVAEGDFLKQDNAGTYPVIKKNDTIGKISFANTRLGVQNGTSGYGSLAKITFNATFTGVGSLNLRNIELVDTNIQSISVSVINGTINVLS